jgi:hypothetical protein
MKYELTLMARRSSGVIANVGAGERPLVATDRSPEVMAARIVQHPFGCIAQPQEIAVEGNVARDKRLKRDGYGRATFDVFRAQILVTPDTVT